jgi:hypothetical protein
VLALVAVVGIGCQLLGAVTGSSLLQEVGFWLLAPYLVAGLLLLVVLIPVLIMKNRQERAGDHRPVAGSQDRVLVRLWRKNLESMEELGRLVAGEVAGTLQAAGRLRPEFALTGATMALETEPAMGATFQLTLPLAEEGLRLALVLRVGDQEHFDLKATAVAPEGEPVAGIRLEVEGGGLPAPVALVSDNWGDFAAEQREAGWLTGLPLGAYRLRVRLPGRTEEFGVDLPDVRELCRREMAARRGTGEKA